MIFASSNKKIFIILNYAGDRTSRQIMELLGHGWEVAAYLVESDSNPAVSDNNVPSLIPVSASELPSLIKKDFLKNKLPTLILFEDEQLLNNSYSETNLPADYRVYRFSEFDFLLGYQHCDSTLLQFSHGAAGFTCQAEKRFFQPDSEAPELALSHTGSWIVKNKTEDPKGVILNSYFSPDSRQFRSQARIDQPLVSHVWRQQDFLDLAMRRLEERNLAESLWAITQASRFSENRKLILQFEALVSILSRNKDDYELLKMNLSSKEMLDLPESCFLLSELAAAQGLTKEAKNILEALYTQLPSYALVSQRLARDYLTTNSILSAREYLMRSLASDPFNPVTLLDLSQIELQSDKLVEAESLIEQASLSPKVESRVFLQKAFIYRKRMKPVETLANLQRYIDLEEAYVPAENSRQVKIIMEIKKEILHLRAQLSK